MNPAFWPVIPRKVPVHGHVVHVGWFAVEQDPHKLMLLSYAAGRWDLPVIPPETAPATAARLMTAATDPSRILTATGLIDGGQLRHGASGGKTASGSFRLRQPPPVPARIIALACHRASLGVTPDGLPRAPGTRRRE